VRKNAQRAKGKNIRGFGIFSLESRGASDFCAQTRSAPGERGEQFFLRAARNKAQLGATTKKSGATGADVNH
jgi:hypothetical protein